jgi:hypothetical protein
LQEFLRGIFCDIKNISSAFAQKFSGGVFARDASVARLAHQWNAPEIF